MRKEISIKDTAGKLHQFLKQQYEKFEDDFLMTPLSNYTILGMNHRVNEINLHLNRLGYPLELDCEVIDNEVMLRLFELSPPTPFVNL